MTETQGRLAALVDAAIDAFNDREQHLINADLSERCICAKFMTYLDRELAQSEFWGYMTDVEYNRGYQECDASPKQLDGPAGKVNIVVDLVVHKRRRDLLTGSYSNLICIEMKKGYKGYSYTSDKERLRKLTDNAYGYCYSMGFMIIIERKRGVRRLRVEQSFPNERDDSVYRW